MNVPILCRDCRWWTGKCYDEPKFKVCSHPKSQPDRYIPDGFGCADGEPYNHDAFVTGPEFGCIHGESKS